MGELEELAKKFGQGYEVIVEQESSPASKLLRILEEKKIEGSWSFIASRDIFDSPNNCVDFRQFANPGLYSPVRNKNIPAIRLAVRDRFNWNVLVMPWEARNYIDAPFEKIYKIRFAVAKMKDYRTDEVRERHCGDEDEEC